MQTIEKDYSTTFKKEDGKLYAHTIYNNKKALEMNKALRNSGMIDKGRLNLHDGADIRAAISFPSVLEYNNFMRDNPDIDVMLKSKDESERMKAVKKISLLEPEYVIMIRL